MPKNSKPADARRYSRLVVDGVKQAPSRAMLARRRFRRADFEKPQVGIASTWSNVTPCNMHIDKLAREAEQGAEAAGGKAIIFNTITISDGISMGTEGMKYSLVSREVIADSIETVVGCPGLRRLRGHRRLRQEHARLPHGDGAPESPGGVRLWRHDSARLHHGDRASWTSFPCSKPSAATRTARCRNGS